MKRYKLKRDLPTFKAGEIFYLSDAGNLFRESDDIAAYSWSTIDKFPNILADWFEEIKEPTRWKPEQNQDYCYVNSGGCVCYGSWSNGSSLDNGRFEIGNCFETKEEAEKVVEYLKALAVVRGDATKKFVKGERNWFVFYNVTADYLDFGYDYSDIRNGVFGLPLFATADDARRSIEKHKNEWLTIFGIKEEE